VSFQSCSIPCLDNDIAFRTCCRLRLVLGRKSVDYSFASQQNDRDCAPSNAKQLDIAYAALSASITEVTIFWVHVSPETLVRRGEITNHYLIAYSLSNTSAQNYQNGLTCVEAIVSNISVVFETQCTFNLFMCVPKCNKFNLCLGPISHHRYGQDETRLVRVSGMNWISAKSRQFPAVLNIFEIQHLQTRQNCPVLSPIQFTPTT